LVDAAMVAVRRYGPEASIDQMASVAGVSKPVLYSEFGGKLGLVDAVAVQLAERVERAVFATLLARGKVDLEGVIDAIVDALVTVIEDEPELYAFLVRHIRMSDRGFLDNALVGLIHERATLVVQLVASEADEDELSVLVDGVFGFVFSVVESWLRSRRLPKDRLVRTVASVIRAGLIEVAGAKATSARAGRNQPAVLQAVTDATLRAGS
jgi:AcrR family transcriptional regulator